MKQADCIADLRNCKTPERLHSAIEKCLDQHKDTILSPEDLAAAYNEARKAVRTFRNLYHPLPPLPDRHNDNVAGLEVLTEWCIGAIDVVNKMVLDLDAGMIEESIELLEKLKELPASGFPIIDKDLSKEAEQKAQRIVDKYRAREKKAPRDLLSLAVTSRTRFRYAAEIISTLADIAKREGTKTSATRSHPLPGKPVDKRPLLLRAETLSELEMARGEKDQIERSFIKAVEKIYRLKDETYTNALVRFYEAIIKVGERINELAKTPTGILLDKYDKLSGLQLQDRYNKIGAALEIDAIVESELLGPDPDDLFGRESKESIVDSAIGTLEEIRDKIPRSQKGKLPKGKKPEQKFKPWPNKGDARLVIDGQRVKFYDGSSEPKNLRLRNDSHTHQLLKDLTSGSMRPDEIKNKLSPNTKNTAAKIVDYANSLLNKKIRSIGFTCLPDYDVEFIERDKFGSYIGTLPIVSIEEFKSWQQERE